MRGEQNLSGRDRASAVTDRELAAAVLGVLQNQLGLKVQTVQRVQALTGERTDPGSSGFPKAALRRSDLSAIGDMKPMKSQKLTAAPTMDDYNALRDDVMQIFQALSLIAAALNAPFNA